MPESVVDLLEVVEVDEDQYEHAVAHRFVEAAGEQQPVGQSRQRVVQHLVGEFALGVVEPPGHQPLRIHRDDLPGSDEDHHQHDHGDNHRTQQVSPHDMDRQQQRDTEES